jgi:PKD repeat protein
VAKGVDKNPSYSRASVGSYTVAVTATGSGDSNTATESFCVTVSHPPSDWGYKTVSSARLVAACSFDESSGSRAQDASGKGKHGAPTNVTRSSPAKFGRVPSLTGSNTPLTVNDGNSLNLASAMTLSAWVYRTSWESGGKDVLARAGKSGLAYALSANSDRNQPSTTVRIGGCDRQLTAGNHLATGTWTHLAATCDGARQRLYVKCSQVGNRTETGHLGVSTNPLRIGGSVGWAGQFFQRRVDEVLIYKRALSRSEIAVVAEQPVTKSAQTAQPARRCATLCTSCKNTAVPGVAVNPKPSAIDMGLKARTTVGFYESAERTGDWLRPP